MSVFVDPLMNHGWHLGKNCHMYADTPEELHMMAARIGLKRLWFQPNPTVDHYDLTESRRKRAVSSGAIEQNSKEAVATWRRLSEMR